MVLSTFFRQVQRSNAMAVVVVIERLMPIAKLGFEPVVQNLASSRTTSTYKM